MESDRRGRWVGRGAEGLTIIVSILLALLADAAWDYRQDRAEERQLLVGLRAEFSEAADEVSSDLDARDQILEQTRLLLNAREGSSAALSLDSVPQIVLHLLDWRFYSPVHAVLDDALSSGRFELIRADEVRAAVMSYVQARERLPVFEELERDFVTRQLEPYLSTRLALDVLQASSESGLERARRESERLVALLNDDTFGSLLYLRVDRTRSAIVFAGSVERAVARVQSALEAPD